MAIGLGTQESEEYDRKERYQKICRGVCDIRKVGGITGVWK